MSTQLLYGFQSLTISKYIHCLSTYNVLSYSAIIRIVLYCGSSYLKSLVQYGLRRIKWILFGAHLFLIISESALNFDQQLSCEQLNKLLEPKSSLNQNQILQNYNVKSKVFFFSFSIHFSLIFSKSKEWFCSWYIRFHNSWYKSLLSILIQVKIISMIKLTCLIFSEIL